MNPGLRFLFSLIWVMFVAGAATATFVWVLS